MTNLVYSAFHYLQKCIKERVLCKNYAETADNSAQMSKQYANDKINQTYLSNNIIEIPQDIKLELKDDILTLKAGSKVYIPNGFEEDGVTPRFDVVITNNDVVIPCGNPGARMAFLGRNGLGSDSSITLVVSGNAAPTGTDRRWYDTANNVIKEYIDGSWQKSDYYSSLPLALLTSNDDKVFISIDQVFNGFGYIGSSKFRLPGIEFLTPNGRNDDGTLRSDKKVTQNVIISTYGYQATNQQWFISDISHIRSAAYIIQDKEPTPIKNSFWYSPLKNLLYICLDTTIGWVERHDCVLAAKNIYTDSSYKITSIDFIKPFRVANGNDVAIIDNFRVVSTLPSTPFEDIFYFIPE